MLQFLQRQGSLFLIRISGSFTPIIPCSPSFYILIESEDMLEEHLIHILYIIYVCKAKSKIINMAATQSYSTSLQFVTDEIIDKFL